MPRQPHLGYRYLKTVQANAASLFSRLHLVETPRAIISKLPFSKHDEIKEWSQRVLESSNRNDPLLSPNHGQVVAVKDNFTTNDLPTTCASDILKGFQAPSPSTVCQLLEQYGMVVVAKTNMDEFGMGSHSTYSAYGPVLGGLEPQKYSVGGSSGGSAAAIANGLVHSAIGSDTGGSVRLPAAYTGIVGFKPSYGRISRHGLIPYANSLDTVGIMAKDVLDVWLLFKMLDRHDPQDPTSLSFESRERIRRMRNKRVWSTKELSPEELPLRTSSYSRESPLYPKRSALSVRHLGLRKGVLDKSQRRRIGVPDEYNIQELHPLVRRAWLRTLSLLHAQGHEIVPISLPNTKQALGAYYVLAPAEASSNLAKYDGVRYGATRSADKADDAGGTLYAEHRGMAFGDEVKRRILLGTFSLSAGAMDNYFIQAQKVRRLVQDDFNQVFRMGHPLMEDAPGITNGVDLILCPTAPTLPPLLSELKKQTPLDSYINDVFTVPASLAGLPTISVPATHNGSKPTTAGRNIGMQIIGQYGDDSSVLTFARMFLHPLLHRSESRQSVPTALQHPSRYTRIT